MCAAAASTPEAMMVLAVQKLYYNIHPSAAIGFFLTLSTQMLGYGVAGLLRTTLVYPSKMLYPTNLPAAALLENLHRDRKESGKRLRIFHIAFVSLFFWQAFPMYISKLRFLGVSRTVPNADNRSTGICRHIHILFDYEAQHGGYELLRRLNGERRSRDTGYIARLDSNLYVHRN
jgi:hypothetical protein